MTNCRKQMIHLIILTVLLVCTLSSVQADEFENVQIQAEKVAEGIYMLTGSGGNIGISVGEDGVFMIDDQFAPLTDKIKAAVATVSDKPIRFILNTHWHFDHTGGNEKMGETGSVIVAHENVRKRLSTDQFVEFFQKKVPALAKEGLPVITFTKDVTFHLNGDEIYVFHTKNAHTDGDVVIYFKKANVVHTGDSYFSGMYPFIDLSTGGTIDGTIQAVKQILSMTNDTTRYIPGHGPLSNRNELEKYLNMLTTIRDRINKQISEKKTVADILSMLPTKKFDETWGKGMIQPDAFVRILYEDLSKDKK